MNKIPMQDPLSTEIQSPLIAGIVESLNRVSDGVDMMAESLTKVQMSPVAGLDTSDPRRIYQVPDGKRIWLSVPEPQIYLNNQLITSDSSQFTVDLIGGSITFYGEYRPEEDDVITVSCEHIYSSQKTGVGCQIDITFSEAFINKEFTLTGGDAEIYTGTVDSTLSATFLVKEVDTDYTVSAVGLDGKPYKASVHTGPYFGKYSVSLNMFSAKIEVTTEPTATVTAKGTSASYEASANEHGVATVPVPEAGKYLVSSTYKDASSNTETVTVEESEQIYRVTVKFITLTVTIDAGSTVQVKNGATTLTEIASDGTVLFYLPNTGTWTVTATKGDKSADTSVEVSAYRQYSVELAYETHVSEVLNENTWEVIREVADSGQASSYWDVGDTKSIVLNGTIRNFTASNLVISAFILGFNHNSSREGNNLIHFCIGKVGTKLVGLYDSEYDDFYVPPSGDGFIINTSRYNAGGWKSCYMRTTILGNNGSPSSPVSGSFISTLPSDLRAVMKSVTKYSNNVSGTNSTSQSHISSTADWVWLFSEYEIWGTREFANQYEQNYQAQYNYFMAGNSKKGYKYNSTGTRLDFWTRSPSWNDSVHWIIDFKGDPYAKDYLTDALGLVACFAV